MPSDENMGDRRKSAPGKDRSKKERQRQRVGKKKTRPLRKDKEDQSQYPKDPFPRILPNTGFFFGRNTGVGALDSIGHPVEMEGPGQKDPDKKKDQGQKKRGEGGKKPEKHLRPKSQERAQKKPGQKKDLRPYLKGRGSGVDPAGDRKSRQKGKCQKNPGSPIPKPFALFWARRGRGVFGVDHPGPASETEASAKVAMRL